MALFKQNQIETLRQKAKAYFGDLKDYLIAAHVDVFFDNKRGLQPKTEGYTRCLKCQKKTLIIHPTQEIAHCTVCGAVADHLTFFQEVNKFGFRKAVWEMCKLVGMPYKQMFE